MIVDLERTYSREFKFSQPIQFMDYIHLHPIKFIHIDQFNESITSLLYSPLDYDDLQLSTLPRLYFLTEIFNHTEDIEFLMKHPILIELVSQLKELLTLVLQDQSFDFVKVNNRYILRVYIDETLIDSSLEGFIEYVDINSKDFNTLREIILGQNGCNYSDEFIHADVKRYMRENTSQDDFSTTVEDCMEAIMIELGILDESKMLDMSLRRFNRFFNKIVTRENYKMQTTASLSGFVTIKGGIPHWLDKQDKYAQFERLFEKAKTV